MNDEIIKSVLKEYGVKWAVNRSLYSIKLKMMLLMEKTERLFEKKVNYPRRIDIFDIKVEKIKELLYSLPKEKKEELKSRANNACEGKIFGFSSILLDYGYPLDWQLNPITKKRSDEKLKWYRISDFDSERGDIKVIWEASRFSHFITLTRAYLLTGDKRYYKAFSEQLDHWIKSNPYSYGANFKCGQECSLRLVNALLAYTVFAEEKVTTDIDKKNMERLILRCYRKVLSNFFYAYKCIKNNHTISELMGMIVGAWCCEDEERISYAFKKFDEVIDRQFTADGGYIQYSFNYTRLALQDIEVVLSIERKAAHKLSERSRRKILSAVNLMYQCQDESGDMPNYGSNDGALVFPVSSCEYRDFRPVINTVYAILSGKKLYQEGPHEEECFWFGNDCSCEIEQKDRVSTSFNKAGIFTFRGADSWAMVVLNDYKSRPVHMDQMHFEMWMDGVNVLCDGGTYSYASDEGKELLKNSYHNTVVYNNQLQMNMYGNFMIYDWTERGRVEHNDKMFYGEMKSKNDYEHCRIVEVRDNGYKIRDIVKGQGRYRVIFHTLCDVMSKDDGVELRIGNKTFCMIKGSVHGKAIEAKCIKGFRSLFYLQKEEITRIEFVTDTKGTFETEIIIREKQ